MIERLYTRIFAGHASASLHGYAMVPNSITMTCVVALKRLMLVSSSAVLNALQMTYINQGIVNAESSLCATIH